MLVFRENVQKLPIKNQINTYIIISILIDYIYIDHQIIENFNLNTGTQIIYNVIEPIRFIIV